MFLLRLRRIEACLLLALFTSCTSTEMRLAPHPEARPVNQLSISGNACGPAALLASFRTGSDTWRKAADQIPGNTDRQQLDSWIRRYGLRPSKNLNGKLRWSHRGINVVDLVDAANEMNQREYLPQLAHDDLFLRSGESPKALLRRTRAHLEQSIAKGIPPLLSLRRFSNRSGTWTPIDGHFVTVIGVPRGLAKGASAFSIRYLDPLGGKEAEGTIRIPDSSLLSTAGKPAACLEAQVPKSRFGSKNLRSGESSTVVPAAIIGRW